MYMYICTSWIQRPNGSESWQKSMCHRPTNRLSKPQDLGTPATMLNLVILAAVLISVTEVTALPLSRSTKTVVITPDNLRDMADYLDDSVSLSDRYIYVSSGSYHETLIRVPLAGQGELDSQVFIRVTVGFYPGVVTSDSDIRVGIYDGSIYNQFYLYDTSASYVCQPYSGTSENVQVSENYVNGEVTLYFQPFHKYGACQSSHDGGYINPARFNSQVDATKGLSLLVNRDTYSEQYKIYYFIVEIL